MNHLNFLSLANELKSSSDEVKRRTSVSRAYYAVFHHVKAFIEQNNLERVCRLNHDAAIRMLYEASKYSSGKEDFKRLSKDLESLKTERVRADYHMDLVRFSRKKCEDFYDDCNKFIADFDNHKGQDLIDSIKEYMSKLKPTE